MSRDKDLQDVLSDIAAKTAQARLQAIEAEKDSLNERQTRVMEYFWDRERQTQRRSLSIAVIFFFEQDRQPPGGETVIDQQTKLALATLLAKDFIRQNANDDLELDARGVKWILHAHPPLARWWQKWLERVPPLWQLAAAVVGLPASVFGIIQFVAWLTGSPPSR